MTKGEIFVVTGSGQGHIHPSMAVCNLLSSLGYQSTLVFSSNLSSAIPSSFTHSLLPISPPQPRHNNSDQSARNQSGQDIEAHLAARAENPDFPPLICAVVDFQMGWTKGCFWKFHIPIVGFFTFGACATALEWGAWKINAGDLEPGESRAIPGLPEEMGITYLDTRRKPFKPIREPGIGPNGPVIGRGPPKPGDKPPWVSEIEGSIGLMFNTCDDLERPFIEYMADQMRIPAWGVGPLLPDHYWESLSPSLTRDRQVRPHKKNQSKFTEKEITQWLDSKPDGSVLYVAFGSEVGPTIDEYTQLAAALEDSNGPFIWVIRQSEPEGGKFVEELSKKVGDEGLIIHGWAPQFLILSHKSTGGFLSHCGWNSTVESIVCGVPLLTWPIRGDQYFNAKLVVNHLKLGYRVADDLALIVRKDKVLHGIERLMGDGEIKRRAIAFAAKFECCLPRSSWVALSVFRDFVKEQSSLPSC